MVSFRLLALALQRASGARTSVIVSREQSWLSSPVARELRLAYGPTRRCLRGYREANHEERNDAVQIDLLSTVVEAREFGSV